MLTRHGGSVVGASPRSHCWCGWAGGRLTTTTAATESCRSSCGGRIPGGLDESAGGDRSSKLLKYVPDDVGRQEAEGHCHPDDTMNRVITGERGLQTDYLDVTPHGLCVVKITSTLCNARQHGLHGRPNGALEIGDDCLYCGTLWQSIGCGIGSLCVPCWSSSARRRRRRSRPRRWPTPRQRLRPRT